MQEIDELNKKYLDACREGKVETIKNLLTSPHLIEHADIHVNNDQGFVYACYHNQLEVVKYLLTSVDLTEHIKNTTQGFTWAAEANHHEIVSYLVLEYDMEMNSELMKWLNGDNCFKRHYTDIINMFSSRDLNKVLEKSLACYESSFNIPLKKMKV